MNLPPGFQAERLYQVPNRQGSWVSLATDKTGRLIASDQFGGLYRIDSIGSELLVEKIGVKVGFAQGLLCAFDSLYVVAHEGKFKSRDDDGSPTETTKPAGLYRLRDTNDDDQYDSVELLRQFEGGGEHGPHAVILGPNKNSLYICAGNHTKIPNPEKSVVPRVWKEDQITPRLPDPGGHAVGVMAPGGWVCKTDPDGKQFELISTGFRNQYDIAFNQDGELFTYDADMEWDIGLPWYRPTRVCHVTSGSEFGWRNGSGKWPIYFADSLPPVVDIGPGSPTGITFGTNSNFPPEFQRSLFIGDWSYGIIYRVQLEPEGSTYRGTKTTFCGSPALPVTDLAINPSDGAMYFLTGGRRSQSALYRITYTGKGVDNDLVPQNADTVQPGLNDLAKLRRKIERLHSRPDDPTVIDTAWPYLSHQDRFIRYAARTAIELNSEKSWYSRAFAEPNSLARLESLMAVLRTNQDDRLQDKIVDALVQLDFETLPEAQRLHLLRNCGLVLLRLDTSERTLREMQKLAAYFPGSSELVNRELARLLSAANSPQVVGKTLAHLEMSSTQQSQIHYAIVLHAVTDGWTQPLRERYLKWFVETGRYAGGSSFRNYLNNIRNQFAGHLTDQQRAQLKQLINTPITTVDPIEQLSKRPTIQRWSIEDFDNIDLHNRDLANGKQMFGLAQCFRCHIVNGEGGIVGPDVTNAGRRFTAHDLLQTIIHPDKAISDQYQATVFQLTDGQMITGRVANRVRNQFLVQEDMMRPGQLTTVKVDEIEAMRPSQKSLMPTGLLDTLTRDEILDLLAYMRSTADDATKGD